MNAPHATSNPPSQSKPTWHIIVVRKEFTGGTMGSQVAHAAGESASLWTWVHGRDLPKDTNVALLGATKAQLAELQAALRSHAVLHTVMTETEGMLTDVVTAIGLVTEDRDALCVRIPMLDRNKPDGLKRYK